MFIEQVIERIAENEHERWVAWAKSLEAKERLSEEQRLHWRKFYVPYSSLPQGARDVYRKVAEKYVKWIRAALEE